MTGAPAFTLALTGGTGFVGGHVITAATGRGWRVRALTRRPRPPRAGVDWIAGALDDPAALSALVSGADAVAHVAGVVNARDRAGFTAGNVTGTLAMVEAARDAHVPRFIHVSSLAAREPRLSDYGWSKARGEAVVRASGLDWTIVRPPAVFGPGDTEMFELFRFAARGVALLPPAGRMSAIFGPDLADLLCTLSVASGEPVTGATYEVGDRRTEGWSHRAFARAIGHALGRRHVSTMAMPAWALRAAARIDCFARRDKAKLTPDRARYLTHRDWVADPALAPPTTLWTPRTPMGEALRVTADWYRREGWLAD